MNLKMRIAVISDTHDVLREDVLKRIEKADAVIHAGDFCSERTYDAIRESLRPDADFFCVQGNNDRSWGSGFPITREFMIGDIRFFLVHDRQDIPQPVPDSQIIIFGHSHQYLEREENGILYLNPGSCGRPRFHLELSMAEILAENGKYTVEKIVLETAVKVCAVPENRLALIKKIMKRMDKGQSIGHIAAKLCLEPELVEMICRIRVTHPGVTAGGILDKWEANDTIRTVPGKGAR